MTAVELTILHAAANAGGQATSAAVSQHLPDGVAGGSAIARPLAELAKRGHLRATIDPASKPSRPGKLWTVTAKGQRVLAA